MGAPLTLPAPPLLIWTLPATLPVPMELALLLMMIEPGVVGGTALTGVVAVLTPVPMEPWPLAGPPPVRLELRAVLDVPAGPGVGVGTLTAWPVVALVWAEAVRSPKPSAKATAQRRRKNFIERPIILSGSGKGSTAKLGWLNLLPGGERARRDSNPRPAD